MLTDSRTISRTWRFVLIMLISISGIASIIGSGGSGAAAPDTAPPVVTITDPPSMSSTDAPTQTVIGTASDETGVASVSINGIPATSSDGFANWQAVVPLTAGANTLTASAVDTLGIADPDAASVVVNAGGGPPMAVVTFPPAVSSTNALTLTVAGTADDATGVASVSVNGVPAATSDDFATWRAVVPIVAGANTLTVATADALGISDPAAATVTVNVDSDLTGYGTNFVDGYAVALASNFAFVTDFSSDALVSIDTTTGNSVIVSDGMIGTGPAFDGPGGTVLVNGNTAALVTNWRTVPGPILGELLSVDLVSGNRTVVSDGTTGMGPILFGPIGVALVDATMALVTNNAADELMSVDLTNGNRTIVSGFGIGAGPEIDTPEGVTMDTANNRALVTDSFSNSLMAVTLVDGNRTIISDATTGTGPNFNFPIGVVVDSANNRALVASSFSNLILAVDLATGNRTIFSDDINDPANGTGPVLDFPSGIALDGKDTAFVSGGKLWAVELGSGDRVIVGN
jgi:hypothetical protein